jgi:hypothetical protein
VIMVDYSTVVLRERMVHVSSGLVSIVIVGADSVRVSRQSVSIARMKKTTTRVKRILGKRLNIIFLLNSPKVSDL